GRAAPAPGRRLRPGGPDGNGPSSARTCVVGFSTGAPLRRKPGRPGSVTTVLVFLFIYGGLGMCCNSLGLAGAAGGASGFQAKGSYSSGSGSGSFDTEAEMEKHAPGYKIVARVRAGVGVVLALLPTAAGV